MWNWRLVLWRRIDVLGPARPARRARSTMLARMAQDVGAVQIQTRGTLAGNLASSSPAEDGVPALMAPEAVLTLASARGARRVPTKPRNVGYRKRCSSPTSSSPRSTSACRRREPWVRWQVGTRLVQAISKVALASAVTVDAGRVTRAHFGMASVGPTTAPLAAVRAEIVGKRSPASERSRSTRRSCGTSSPSTTCGAPANIACTSPRRSSGARFPPDAPVDQRGGDPDAERASWGRRCRNCQLLTCTRLWVSGRTAADGQTEVARPWARTRGRTGRGRRALRLKVIICGKIGMMPLLQATERGTAPSIWRTSGTRMDRHLAIAGRIPDFSRHREEEPMAEAVAKSASR